MGEREELSSLDSKLRVRKQELEKRLRELEGKGANVSYGEKMEVVPISEERHTQIESIRKEIDEINAKQREIVERIRKLPPSGK
jgi:uncharacterized coiled-coil DUF342 family protein